MQIFFLIFVATLGLTMWGRKRFRKIYDQETKFITHSEITGAELARKILDSHGGMSGVKIVRGMGILADFYDPRKKQISLAPQHFGGATYSALGIAANQAGSAIQHYEGHRPRFWRVSAIRTTIWTSLPLVMIGAFTLLAGMGKTGFPMVVMIWSLIALMNLITIPTELDSSERAKVEMRKFKPFRNLDERVGVERVMGAACTQYVDGFFAALSWVGSLIFPSPKPKGGKAGGKQ